MALQKFRKSKSATMKRRRANDKRTLYETSTCPECKALIRPHRVCPECGAYKGKTVIKVKTPK